MLDLDINMSVSDTISFKIIDGQIAVGEVPKYSGVVGIFINDRELLDIVADLEKSKSEEPMDYIHQTAKELYHNLTDGIADLQKENGVEILCCTCGVVECSSPIVFIEKDERYVYWKALGHNQIEKKNYCFPLDYVFDRKQYEQALEELKKLVKDKSVY